MDIILLIIDTLSHELLGSIYPLANAFCCVLVSVCTTLVSSAL